MLSNGQLYTQKIGDMYSNKYLYMNGHRSTIQNNQKVETIEMSINWWVDKQYGAYPYNRMLLSHTHYNLHEPGKHAE